MFIVEGNIGTGKSTFLQALQRSLSHSTVTLEAVDYWQNESNGQSILQNFYESPHRWAYTMETIALKIRIQEHIQQQKSTIPNIIERSIYSGYHCFARNSFEQGFLQQVEWNIYNSWFNFLTSKNCLPPSGFIYLRANPMLSYERTVKRSRDAEESISFEYLKQIHEKHEDFLIKKLNIHPSIAQVPVLVLDCNYDLLTDKKKLLDYVEQVQQFIQTHSKKIVINNSMQELTI
ncbi:MAG: deoxynucleoside kinase [Candidatus Dependentiae bacterium]|nr:deoxynucleoside kinase [Candidatus Dependentiae bacterium]